MAGREAVPFKCEGWGGECAATAGGLCRSYARVLCSLVTNLLHLVGREIFDLHPVPTLGFDAFQGLIEDPWKMVSDTFFAPQRS